MRQRWRPANIHGDIMRLPPNCAQIIPATNRSIYILLLNAIQTRIIQLSDNVNNRERFQPFLYIAGRGTFQQKIIANRYTSIAG